jgi:ABC-type transport system involved in multi-copper enzyme maturation permease subunit
MFAICSITIRRIREPAFVLLFLLGACLAYAIADLDSLQLVSAPASAEEELAPPNTVMAGTLLMLCMGCLIAVFSGATEVPRDVSSRMIAIFLSKPLARSEYLWGKFLGTLGLSASYSAAWLIVMLLSRSGDGDAGELTLALVVTQLWCLLLLVPVTAIAVAISCYFSDVAAMIVTAVYIILSFGSGIMAIVSTIVPPDIARIVLVPYYLIPNLTYFLQHHEGWAAHGALLVYAASVAALFTAVGHAHFRRGDVF